jgi:hypothetical protein
MTRPMSTDDTVHITNCGSVMMAAVDSENKELASAFRSMVKFLSNGSAAPHYGQTEFRIAW